MSTLPYRTPENWLANLRLARNALNEMFALLNKAIAIQRQGETLNMTDQEITDMTAALLTNEQGSGPFQRCWNELTEAMGGSDVAARTYYVIPFTFSSATYDSHDSTTQNQLTLVASGTPFSTANGVYYATAGSAANDRVTLSWKDDGGNYRTLRSLLMYSVATENTLVFREDDLNQIQVFRDPKMEGTEAFTGRTYGGTWAWNASDHWKFTKSSILGGRYFWAALKQNSRLLSWVPGQDYIANYTVAFDTNCASCWCMFGEDPLTLPGTADSAHTFTGDGVSSAHNSAGTYTDTLTCPTTLVMPNLYLLFKFHYAALPWNAAAHVTKWSAVPVLSVTGSDYKITLVSDNSDL